MLIEDKQILSAEFLMFKGREMWTPREPYLNSDLYEEILSKNSKTKE